MRTRLLVFIALTASCSAALASVNLPDPNPPANSLVYGDFTVYSMVALQSQFEGAPAIPNNASDPFWVPSADAQDGDIAIVANNNGYQNPVGVSAPFVQPGNNLPAVQTYNNWTATTSALRAALSPGESFVAWMNLNETQANNPNQTATDRDLLIWVLAELVDTETNAAIPYVLGGTNSTTPPVSPAAITDPLDPNWGYVHGQITVDINTGAFLGVGDQTGIFGPTSTTVQQNLGANAASFGAYNKDLSDRILDDQSIYDTLRVTILKFGFTDNGREEIFIRGAVIGQQTVIPEPAALMVWSLLASSAIGLAYFRRHCRG